MKSKKANVMIISLIVLAALGLISSIGFVLTQGISDRFFEEDQNDTYSSYDISEQEQIPSHSTSTISLSPERTRISSGDDDEEEEEDTSSSDSNYPGTVSTVAAISTSSTIDWSWVNPADTDFNEVIIFIDGEYAGYTSSNHYALSGLMPNTAYTISLQTKDDSGNLNPNAVNFTSSTLADTTVPSLVENLVHVSRTLDSITWEWENPSNSDFDENIILLNGNVVETDNQESYTATGLARNTVYTLTVQTIDTSGNINTTVVSDSWRTCTTVSDLGREILICPQN